MCEESTHRHEAGTDPEPVLADVTSEHLAGAGLAGQFSSRRFLPLPNLIPNYSKLRSLQRGHFLLLYETGKCNE